MNLSWYQHIPQLINPVAFTLGPFSVRWYALSYLVGFFVVYLILFWRTKNEYVEKIFHISQSRLPIVIFDFLLVEFFAVLAGGRIGYVFFYNATYFFAHPLSIISPYDGTSGQFVGIYGMSYHGALLGAIFAGYFFAKIKEIDFLKWADFVIIAVPAGYFFGRIGNFLNGELYGRQTSSIFGMYFTGNPSVLRYPSQLLEALLEGLLLFLVLWFVRKRVSISGTLFFVYIMGYAATRFVSEQFREPDPQIGLLTLGLTMGQFLSVDVDFRGSFYV